MNNAILIQQVYPGEGYEPLLDLTYERNKNYCIRHRMDYMAIASASSTQYANAVAGSWCKIELIQRALEKGYQYIIWLDADALIKDLDTDLRDACIDGIGACWMRIPQLNHWNVGVLFVKNVPGVAEFVADWLSYYPDGLKDGWNEQGVFNKLAMQSTLVQTISDRWNATLNYSMVPDAVILGYHGNGSAAQRLEAMKGTLAQLEKNGR